MRRVSRFVSSGSLSAGAVLAAYGGYGAGLGQAGGAGWLHWSQVAAAVGTGVGLFAVGLWRGCVPGGEPSRSFAADLAALERLVPTLRKHPEGLGTLQDLIDVLFEASHRSATTPTAVSSARTQTGGRTDA